MLSLIVKVTLYQCTNNQSFL